jgi:hypothetical protein
MDFAIGLPPSRRVHSNVLGNLLAQPLRIFAVLGSNACCGALRGRPAFEWHLVGSGSGHRVSCATVQRFWRRFPQGHCR